MNINLFDAKTSAEILDKPCQDYFIPTVYSSDFVLVLLQNHKRQFQDFVHISALQTFQIVHKNES